MQSYILLAIGLGIVTLGVVLFFPLSDESIAGKTCVVEGKAVVDFIFDKFDTHCCTDLVKIVGAPYSERWKETNLSPMRAPSICSACGNGICEDSWEHELNCPQDCKGP